MTSPSNSTGTGTDAVVGGPRISTDELAALYEDAPCGHLLTRPDGTILHTNATLSQWLGRSNGELVGQRTFQDLLTAGGRIYHETHYAPLLRLQGEVHEIAVDLRCSDGSRLPVLINSVLRCDAQGAPTTISTAIFKATERRGYEAELLRARNAAEESAARARVLAQTLQESLIPPAAPQVPFTDIGAVYRPAGDGAEVGGDFYDIFETGRGDWAIVLGDVCGKGVEAARVTALARYTVRATAMRTRRPKRILATLNEALLQQGMDRFCTVVYARVRPSERGGCRVNISSGGHALPLRVPEDGSAEEVGRAGSLLGVMDTPTLHDSQLEMRPGDVLVLFTDGVTEARRAGAFYGDAALRHVLETMRDQDAQTIADAILTEVMAYQGGVARDDIAIVVVKAPELAQRAAPAAPEDGAVLGPLVT